MIQAARRGMELRERRGEAVSKSKSKMIRNKTIVSLGSSNLMLRGEAVFRVRASEIALSSFDGDVERGMGNEGFRLLLKEAKGDAHAHQ
jgi:hypothetical protein